MKALTPQDLSLFIGQRVQYNGDKRWLKGLTGNGGNMAILSSEFALKELEIHILKVKPICRRMGLKDKIKYTIRHGIITWENIKKATANGICPFDEWFDQGLVIEKVKELV